MMPKIPDMAAELASLVRQIPRGRVATYGDVARALGDVAASRYVGHEMLHHGHSATCRCHRLVRADGTLGRYVSGDASEKARLLAAEGIVVRHGRVELADYRYTEFKADQPLARLADYQRQVARQVRRCPDPPRIRTAGGVDLSYVPRRDLGVAAFVEVDLSSGNLLYRKLLVQPVTFPYITSYLAFRELPILLQLLQLVRSEQPLPDVTLVDGSGILHPRRAGIATMLGAALRIRTIGVTKKHLAGVVEPAGTELNGARRILHDNRWCGAALPPVTGSTEPLYISPGFGLDVTACLSIVPRSLRGHRLPEPIYWADRLSREAARRWPA